MRSEKSTHEQKKEFLEFFNIDREPAAGEDRKPRANFFTEGFQEREEIQKRIEEPLVNSTNDSDELFREFRLKKKLFSLFIEYFFLNGRIPLKEIIDGLERKIIVRTLLKVNGDKKKAAEVLSIKYSTLMEKVKKHNIRFRINPL